MLDSRPYACTMCDFHNFGLIFAGQSTVCLKRFLKFFWTERPIFRRILLEESFFSSFFCQFLGTHLMIFFLVEHSEDAAELWKIIKYGKKIWKNWRKALFNLPLTHFSADSGYSKIRFQVLILPAQVINVSNQPCNLVSKLFGFWLHHVWTKRWVQLNEPTLLGPEMLKYIIKIINKCHFAKSSCIHNNSYQLASTNF